MAGKCDVTEGGWGGESPDDDSDVDILYSMYLTYGERASANRGGLGRTTALVE